MWNSIYLLPDGAWKGDFFFPFFCCCRKIHCRLRKEGLKRWGEFYGRLWKIQGLGFSERKTMRWKIRCEMCQGEEKTEGRALWEDGLEAHIHSCYFPVLCRVFLCPFFLSSTWTFRIFQSLSFLPHVSSMRWSLLSAAILSPGVFFSSREQILHSLLLMLHLGFSLTITHLEAKDDMMLSGRRGEKGNRF